MGKLTQRPDLVNVLAACMAANGVDAGAVLEDVRQRGRARLDAEERRYEAARYQPSARARAAELASAAADSPTAAAERPSRTDGTWLERPVNHEESREDGADVAGASAPSSSRGRTRKSPESLRDKSTKGPPRRGKSARRRKSGSRRKRNVERFRDLCVSLGQRDAAPVAVPRAVWGAARAIMLDITGRAARGALADLRGAPGVAQLVRKAALGERVTDDGELVPRLDWSDSRARAVVASFMVLWRLGKKTGRPGFARAAAGVSRRLVAAIVTNPATGRHYSLEALYAITHRGEPGERGRWQDGSCGFIEALQQVGALYRQQPPASKMPASHVGPNGWAYNIYWFAGRLLEVLEDEPPPPEPPDGPWLGAADDGARAPP